MSDSKPPFDTGLAARTAEALALPQMVCRHRKCRRGNRCRWFFRATMEPCCLQNLDAGQRRVFDQVYDRARFAQGFLGSNGELFETRTGGQRILDEVAIGIARHTPNRWRPDCWDAARRERHKRLPPAAG